MRAPRRVPQSFNEALRIVATAFAVAGALGCSGTFGGGKGGGDDEGGKPGAGGSAGAQAGASGSAGGGASGAGGVPDDGRPPLPPFEPLSAATAAAKAKDYLTGLPLTDDELLAVQADAKKLPALVDAWVKTPAARERLFEFFREAFQQVQLETLDLEDMIGLQGGGWTGVDRQAFLRTVTESFARTVLALMDEGRPFTDAITTRRFMMNPPLMAALAFLDTQPQDDDGKPVAKAADWMIEKYPNLQITLTTNKDAMGVPQPIPVADSLNPASPRFMVWSCDGKQANFADPLVVKGAGAIRRIFHSMYGGRSGCGGSQESAWTADDWASWKMVTVRAPKQGETKTVFWELAKLRDPKTTELVLTTPRVGFMSTIAFFANWPTNPSNSYRVLTNQAMIVGLGTSFDDRDTVVQVADANEDMHIQPGTACFGCHQTLDPMRDLFRQSYSITYFQQLALADPKKAIPTEGVFKVGDAPAVRGAGVETFARGMAEHPSFAPAWVMKACHAINASPCEADDPEVQRIAEVWKASGFKFEVLVREVLTSPLVTFAARTATSEAHGIVLSIARRDGFCARLSARLGIPDVCGRSGPGGLPRVVNQVRNLSLGIPGSGYARGDDKPLTPHDPNMFFHAGTEKLCAAVAPQLVDGPMGVGKWKSAAKDAAIVDFTTSLIGLPPMDPRHEPMTQILRRHYDAAIAAKESPADALRSVFVLACSSPLAVSVGL